MPRAHRFFLPGYVWHITHRCHDKSFLLERADTRFRWIEWLHKARIEYGISILNYAVTCNHIHLLTAGGASRNAISKSMQLVAGRTAQEFNLEFSRHGAFWEDRYHATAIESGAHLLNCLTYIDLNMVRTGVVTHPGDWPHCGYWEIRNHSGRFAIIDRKTLLACLQIADEESLRTKLDAAVDDAIARGLAREPKWSEAVAVGNPAFLAEMKSRLGKRAIRRSVVASEIPQNKTENVFALREPMAHYGEFSKSDLECDQDSVFCGDNTCLWTTEGENENGISRIM